MSSRRSADWAADWSGPGVLFLPPILPVASGRTTPAVLLGAGRRSAPSVEVRNEGRRAVGTSCPTSASREAQPIPRTPGVNQASRSLGSGAGVTGARRYRQSVITSRRQIHKPPPERTPSTALSTSAPPRPASSPSGSTRSYAKRAERTTRPPPPWFVRRCASTSGPADPATLGFSSAPEAIVRAGR